MSKLLLEQWPELLDKALQHLLLTGISTGIAILVGIPVALIILQHARLRSLIMAFISILQTIPSLALLAFLLPLFGIGAVPALVALTLYALLPIVRNTLTGLQNVPESVLEACAALGYTRRQQLLQVELPLALPFVIAGIRTAAVISVGIATLAAFIGAGGLGDFIVRGLATNNTQLILFGAVPAALLALFLDFIIQRIERHISLKRNTSSRTRGSLTPIHLAVLSVAVVLTGLILAARLQPSFDRDNTVIVASKNFTEQIILGEMIAQLLEAHTDLKVVRKLNLGSVTLCHQALLNGDIDIYPEYTGTAFRVILERQDNLPAEATYTAVLNAYSEDYQLKWLTPFGFNNTYAVAVRRSIAEDYALDAISDLNSIDSTTTIGFASEFYERSDGYPSFIRHYNLAFADTAEMDLSLLFQALADERVDIAVGNSTDGRIAALNLHVLADDKHYFPPYYAAPVIRQDILDRHPVIATALQLLANQISANTMQQMNYAVSHDGLSAATVATAFLSDNQLL